MAMTDPAVIPEPPLLARLWPRMAKQLADRPAGPDFLDWAVAAACFAAFTVPVLPGGGSASPAGPAAAFGVMAAAPLIVRRRWPASVVLVVAAVYVAAALADVAFTPFVSNAGPNLAIAAFAVADGCRRPLSLAVVAAAGAATWASLPVAVHLHPGHDQDAVQSRPAPGNGGGLGIPGMRERAELLGGTLSAAREPDGGFNVTAWLPAGERQGSTWPLASGEPE